MRFLSVPLQSNDPSYGFKLTTYKAEKGRNQARMHCLPSEVDQSEQLTLRVVWQVL